MAGVKRIVRMVAVGLVGGLAFAYGVDYAVVTMKVQDKQQAFADVVVDQVYTSTNKWKEVEWSRGNAVTERCVYALFPHYGNRPCWYVQRHTMNVNNTD